MSAKDWTERDRIVWETLSGQLSAQGIKGFDLTRNTFVVAAQHNLQNLGATEYATVKQRNSFYDWASYHLTQPPYADTEVAKIRFFAAANVVTNKYGGLSMVDHPLAGIASALTTYVPEADAADLLRDINAKLFATNLSVLRSVLVDWREPRDPNVAGATQKITAFQFDLNMVRFEQTHVQRHLDDRNVSSAMRERINKGMQVSLFLKDSHPIRVFLSSAGITEFDFFDLRHRIALGCAYIHWFNRRSVEDYRQYMSTTYPK